MKFTEEQFNTLVRFQEDQYPDGLYFGAKDYLGSIDCTLAHIGDNLQWFIYQNNLGNEAVAIMNPATREWAHEQFVEEEMKYAWTSKESVMGIKKRLYKLNNGMVCDFKGKYLKGEYANKCERLSESEIKTWGYNPEMFDKEEV